MRALDAREAHPNACRDPPDEPRTIAVIAPSCVSRLVAGCQYSLHPVAPERNEANLLNKRSFLQEFFCDDSDFWTTCIAAVTPEPDHG